MFEEDAENGFDEERVEPPFPFFDDEFPKEDIDHYTVTKLEPLFDTGRVTTINLINPHLYATQEFIDLNTIERQLSGEWKGSSKLPVVIEISDGRQVIQDGHHRLSALKLDGKKKAKVYLIKLPDGYVYESLRITSLTDALTEEFIGSNGGVSYFQMGSSLPDHLYNRTSDGKPTRDPGLGGSGKKKKKKKKKKRKKKKNVNEAIGASTKFYHAAPPEARKDILANGLEPGLDASQGPPAVYLFKSDIFAENYIDRPSDVWEVETNGLRTYPDPEDPKAAVYYLGKISPERLKHTGIWFHGDEISVEDYVSNYADFDWADEHAEELLETKLTTNEELVESVGAADKDIIAHLKRRGLDPEKTRVIMDKDSDSAVFLLFNLSGQMIGYQQYNPQGAKKGREGSHPETAKYWTWITKEGKKSALAVWGLETVDERPYVFLTEGIFDAVKLQNEGMPAIAVLGNDPKILRSWLKALHKHIIVVADNDSAGRKLGKLGDLVISAPEPYKDLGEMPQEEIREWLESALSFNINEGKSYEMVNEGLGVSYEVLRQNRGRHLEARRQATRKTRRGQAGQQRRLSLTSFFGEAVMPAEQGGTEVVMPAMNQPFYYASAEERAYGDYVSPEPGEQPLVLALNSETARSHAEEGTRVYKVQPIGDFQWIDKGSSESSTISAPMIKILEEA